MLPTKDKLATLGKMFQGMMVTYMAAVLSTIERVFALRSEHSAYVMSGNEISQFLLIFIVPCINQVQRRPLWVGIGMMVSVVGCFCVSFASLTTYTSSSDWVRKNSNQKKCSLQ